MYALNELPHRAVGLLPLGIAAWLSACSAVPPQPAAQPLACQQLAGLVIPAAAIGLPTSGGTVTSATVVAASGTGAAAIPEHCLATGSLAPVDPTAPNIIFRVALPSAWNGKALMFGGGGFDGTVPNVAGNVPAGPTDQPTPLGRGYATFASDSGHQANALGSLDGQFLLNEEATRNFAGNALKKTRDAAVWVIKARYAVAGPSKAYFAGGSTGGREALSVAQRWPADWDGVIAWYPAWNQLSAMMSGHRLSRALAQPGAYPNTPKRVLARKAALEACDALDGVVDGLISHQVRCNAIFDPMTATVGGAPLRCPGGADTGDTCLSDAQITALQVFNHGGTRFNFILASGSTGYPGANIWGADMGETSNPAPLQAVVTFLNFGTVAPSFPMPAGAPYISRQEDAMVRYAIMRDPNFNALTFDPENPGAWAGRVSELSTQLDVSTDLAAYVARGGKLLLAHGAADILVSSRATELYYQRLLAQFGPDKVNTFARYYEVPGFGHGFSTIFNATWDSLTALANWVEDGVAPRDQVTTDTAGVPGRSRPLCDYPKWPQYRGAGNVNAAASFACVP